MRAGSRRSTDLPQATATTHVTRVDAVLRRWSLDELPKLLNGKGEMSLVGPRPHAVSTTALPPTWPAACSVMPSNRASPASHKLKAGEAKPQKLKRWHTT